MNKIKEALGLLRHLARHPANRKWPLGGIVRFFSWQAWKRIVGRPITVKVGTNRKFLVVPDSRFSSQVIYTTLPEWDEMNFLLRYLRRDDRFVDLGANVGFYTVLASTLIDQGEIFSVEANAANTDILRRQVEINALKNVRVVSNAVGKIDGTVRFAATQREIGSIVDPDNHDPSTVDVPCRKLDTILAEPLKVDQKIALAKMDVEGCEMLILEGATQILNRGLIRAWIFEVSQNALAAHGASAHELLETFQRFGYSLHIWDEAARELHPFTGDVTMDHPNLIACLDAAEMKQRLGLL